MRAVAALLVLVVPLACGDAREDGSNPDGDGVAGSMVLLDGAAMTARLAQFAPVEIDFSPDSLEPWERVVLERLVEASTLIHAIFIQQVSPNNPSWRQRLALERTESAAAALRYFDVMAGPWDRLDGDAPFLDVGAKPLGAGFYPPTLTRGELERWIASHPADADALRSYFTTVRRRGPGLTAVRYSDEYRLYLEEAAALLEEAAAQSGNASLADYLRKRAAAFLSNDYYESDVAWLALDSRIEPTIGPYEVYEDGLMGWKAAFESFITVADAAASEELAGLKQRMRLLEERLPIEDRYRNLERAFDSPIRVADLVYAAGDARTAVQTIAFNLPNDERVRAAEGSKKVMLRNVMHAKFDAILAPVAAAVLEPGLASAVAFEPWFTGVLMHELAHGLGPGHVTAAAGERVPVHRALGAHHSAIEEAKADAAGLHSLTVLADSGVYTREFVRRVFLGHVADLMRAVRFGAAEAHGRAALLQLNWLSERGTLRHDAATGRFSADVDSVIVANRALATELLTLQATGAAGPAGELLRRYGDVSPALSAALERLRDIPVDIVPAYSVTRVLRD